MAEKILVTPQALESAEIRMRAASAEFAKSVSCCNTAMNNLGSAWRDEMFAVANGRYEETIKGLLDDVPEVLNAYADMIEDSLRAFEGIDEALKNEIWGMEFMAALALLPPVTTPLGELLKPSPAPSSSYVAPTLGNRSYYSEYIDGYRDKNGVLWTKQCAGYAKGRLNELYGITPKGQWGMGKDAAANIARNNTNVTGRDGTYAVRLSSDASELRAGSIVSFNVNNDAGNDNGVGHVLIVEDVWTDTTGAVQVRFTEANVGGTDGVEKIVPLNAFQSLYAGINSFVYFDKV